VCAEAAPVTARVSAGYQGLDHRLGHSVILAGRSAPRPCVVTDSGQRDTGPSADASAAFIEFFTAINGFRGSRHSGGYKSHLLLILLMFFLSRFPR